MRLTHTRLALIGVLLIIGGEALCIFGPLRFERFVHVTCHAVFYAGIAMVAVAAIGSARSGSGGGGKPARSRRS